MKRPTLPLLFAAILMAAACASTRPNDGWMPPPPESPVREWQAPSPVPPPEGGTTAWEEAPVPPAADRPLTLGAVVGTALRNNPRTRSAWASAQASWAELGSRKSAYYPIMDLNGVLARSKQNSAGGSGGPLTTYGPSVTLTGLLYDFGRREADVGAAEAAYWASGFALNAVLADTILQVEETYYGYLNAKALLEAARAGLADAEESLKAAEERRRAGVATIAEELQARTVRSRALLMVQEAEGMVQSAKGGLATAMGLPATTPFDAGPLPEFAVPADTLDEAIEGLIEAALAGRPDLEASRARALEASREAEKIRAEAWPSLTVSGILGRTYYADSGLSGGDYYGGAVGLRIPLFTGFENAYDRRRAEAEAVAAQAETRDLSNQVVLEVWNSYYAMRTARNQLATSADLLASADESASVAMERYKAGVGTILDLLSTQRSLLDARAQSVLARSGWLVAVARLARDTGRLRAPMPAPKEN